MFREGVIEGPGFLPSGGFTLGDATPAGWPGGFRREPLGSGGNNPLTNPLAKPGDPLPPLFDTRFDASGLTGAADQQCDRIPNQALRAACKALAGAAGGYIGGRTGGGSQQTSNNPASDVANCPAGYSWNGKECVTQGMGRYLPGDVGAPDVVWSPIYGRYGAGVTPIAVQRVQRVCPPGFVVGKDGVCYDRIPRSARAHNPGTKPLLSGGDVNALNRARSLQKKIGKLNTRFGPKKRPASHTHTIGRARKK